MVWRYVVFILISGIICYAVPSYFLCQETLAQSQSEGKKASGKAKNALPFGWTNKEHARLEETTPTPVPDIPFLDENDQPHIFEEFYGQVVLLNFWATWCTPCVQEMPSLSKLQKDFKRKNFKVVAISQDFKGASVVKEFYDVNDITNLNIYVDPRNTLFKAFSVIGLPTSILIDAEGNEIARIIGIVDWGNEDIRQFILKYTDQKTYNVPVKPPSTQVKADGAITVATPMAASDSEKKASSGMMIPVTHTKEAPEAVEPVAEEKAPKEEKKDTTASNIKGNNAAKAKEQANDNPIPENAITTLPGVMAKPTSPPDLADPTARRAINQDN